MKRFLFAFVLCLSYTLLASQPANLGAASQPAANDRTATESVAYAGPVLTTETQYCYGWVTAEWTALYGAVAYEVYYNKGGGYYKVATVTGTSLEFNQNKAGYCRVKAVFPTAVSSFSNPSYVPYYSECL